MNELFKLVVFNLDNQKYALHLSTVETVIQVVEFTSLPKAPKIVNGIVNFHGKIIPVFNIRKRFNLPDKEINLNDHLIIAHTSKRMAALIVDSVSEVISKPTEEIINTGKTDAREIIVEMHNVLRQKSSIEIEYISIVDTETLEDIDRIAGKALVAIAVKLGKARLIDNILIDTK